MKSSCDNTQYTKIYMETKMGESHKVISYVYQDYIHRKHQLPNYLELIGRRLQTPI
jgi:hypothetical protein